MNDRKPGFRDPIKLTSEGLKICVSPLELEYRDTSQFLSNSTINGKCSYFKNSKCRSFLQIFLAYATVVCLTCLPVSVLAQKAQSVPYKQFGKIYGKVAVIMRSGDVKPIAKRMFYVLPFASWELNLKALDEAKQLYGPLPSYLSDKQAHEEQYKKIDKYRDDKLNEAMQQAKNEGKFFFFKTEFDGSYSLDNIPPGNYWVCNAYQDSFAIHIGQSSIVWSVPITIEPGKAIKLDLSNDNAADISN